MKLHDCESEQDTTVDYNRILFNMYMRYTLQILKLIVNIFNIAFFVGIIWIVYDDVIGDIFGVGIGGEGQDEDSLSLIYAHNL